jgi:biopolymer transport protein ExbD
VSRRRQRRLVGPALAIDLTAMVDVVFLLIIFFMVSTTFITLESGLPVDLPQAQSTQAQASGLPTVTITAEQQVFLAGAPVTEDELLATLQATLADEASAGVVVLRADSSVPHGLTVRIMDVIKRAGAQRIAIATGGG